MMTGQAHVPVKAWHCKYACIIASMTDEHWLSHMEQTLPRRSSSLAWIALVGCKQLAHVLMTAEVAAFRMGQIHSAVVHEIAG